MLKIRLISLKFFLIIIFFLVFLFSKYNFIFSITLYEYAKKPLGNILFIRHALAPGFGDPSNFDLNDCNTQRNLSKEGQKQAVKIGEKFKEVGLQFSKIYSSEWCRCKETAKLLNLGDFTTEPGLNSFFQGIVSREKTLSLLVKRLKAFKRKKELFLMVTHQVTISAITGINVSSGGVVAFDIKSGESNEVRIFD